MLSSLALRSGLRSATRTTLARQFFSGAGRTSATTRVLTGSTSLAPSASSSKSGLFMAATGSSSSSSSLIRKMSTFSGGGSGGSAAGGIFSKNTLIWIGAGAGLGLLLNAGSGLAEGRKSDSFDSTTRARLTATYSYVLGSLATTAGAAVMLFRAGLPSFMASSPFIFLGGSIAATIASSMLVRSISFENTVAKHAALGLFCTTIAASLCPLVMLGGGIVLNAAAATGAMVGGLSLLGAMAPSESFLWMHAPLSVGLGVVFAASIGTAFFPASGMLQAICLYGGLAVFGGFTVADTAKVIHNAKYTPIHKFDPINNSISIYMDVINIFVRMVQIMANSKKN